MHGSIEASTLTVTLWMIRGCATLRDAKDVAKFLNHLPLEIALLVAVNPFRFPEPHNPLSSLSIRLELLWSPSDPLWEALACIS